MKYEQIRASLQTGDIVLFSGKGIISSIIKFFSNSEWSHLGMVVRWDDLNVIQLYESTTLSKLSGRKGVQLVSLRDRINTYKGKIAIRRLVTKRTSEMMLKLKDFMWLHRNKKYEQNLWQLFLAAYDGWFGKNKADMSSVFCSELIAALWQLWGILSAHYRVPNEYTPANFAFGGMIDKHLKYSKELACLQKEIVIEV